MARTDAESATFLDGCGDERDQPFILGATHVDLPTYKAGCVAILARFAQMGIDEVRGHLLFSLSASEMAVTSAWLERAGLLRLIDESSSAYRAGTISSVDARSTM